MCNNQENNFVSSFFLKIFHFIFFSKSKFVRIVISLSKFLYNHILTRFGYPLNIVTDQGAHSIINIIHYLTNHFILRHINSTIYYPQGNGQVESINKVFDTLFTKLVNENKND